MNELPEKVGSCQDSIILLVIILAYQLSMGYHIGKYILRINIKIHLPLNPTHRTLENKDKILSLETVTQFIQIKLINNR